jgi:hypothetical protein
MAPLLGAVIMGGVVHMDSLTASFANLLAVWEPLMHRFHAHLEQLNPRLRYHLPPALLRYVRFELLQAVRQQTPMEVGSGLRRLGVHLRAQGFEGPDLDTLGAAWLVALDEVLGAGFDSEAREQWLRFYKVLRSAFLGSTDDP